MENWVLGGDNLKKENHIYQNESFQIIRIVRTKYGCGGHLAPPGGEDSHMKGVGILVISLRGVNFGFWSNLGCSGQNGIVFSREVPKMQLANMMN